MPGDKPSPAEVGDSLRGRPPEVPELTVLAVWHEC